MLPMNKLNRSNNLLLTVTCLALCLFLVSCSEEIQPIARESQTSQADPQVSLAESNTEQVSNSSDGKLKENSEDSRLSIVPQSAYEQVVLSYDFFDETKALEAFPEYSWEKSPDYSEEAAIFNGGKEIRLTLSKSFPLLEFRAFPQEVSSSDFTTNSLNPILLPRSQCRRGQEQAPEEHAFLSVEALIHRIEKMLDTFGYDEYLIRNIETIKKGSELPFSPGETAPADAYGVEAMQVINGLPIYDEQAFGAPCATIQYRVSEKQSEQLSLYYRWQCVRKEGAPRTILSSPEARVKAEEYLSHLPLDRGAKAQELFSLELLYVPLRYLNEEDSKNVLFTPAYLLCVRVLPELTGGPELFKEVLFDAATGELLTLPGQQFSGNGIG